MMNFIDEEDILSDNILNTENLSPKTVSLNSRHIDTTLPILNDKQQAFQLTQERLLRIFFRKIFTCMFLGLLCTFSVVYLVYLNVPRHLLSTSPLTSIQTLILSASLLIIIAIRLRSIPLSIHPIITFTLFILFSISLGFLLAPIIIIEDSILLALWVTTSVFFIMSVYGYATDADLTSSQSLFKVLLIALIFATILNFWLSSYIFVYLLCYIGVFIFLGLMALDVNYLRQTYLDNSKYNNNNIIPNIIITGALRIYLNFINIFLSMLHILNVK